MQNGREGDLQVDHPASLGQEDESFLMSDCFVRSLTRLSGDATARFKSPSRQFSY